MKIRQSTLVFHVILLTQPSANTTAFAAWRRTSFDSSFGWWLWGVRLESDVPAHELDAIGSRGGMTDFQKRPNYYF
jgi:hypothetical protein